MTKRQLIDEIIAVNRTAEPGFLAQFPDDQLHEYLEHLEVISKPRLSGDAHKYDKYFENCPAVLGPAGPVQVFSGERLCEEDDHQADVEAMEFAEEDIDWHDDAPEPSQEPEAEEVEEAALVGAAAGSAPIDDQEAQTPFAKTDEDSESWLF